MGDEVTGDEFIDLKFRVKHLEESGLIKSDLSRGLNDLKNELKEYIGELFRGDDKGQTLGIRQEFNKEKDANLSYRETSNSRFSQLEGTSRANAADNTIRDNRIQALEQDNKRESLFLDTHSSRVWSIIASVAGAVATGLFGIWLWIISGGKTH